LWGYLQVAKRLPPGGTREREEWRALLIRAAQPGVCAKISGLYPPIGDRASWTTDAIRPFIEIALEVFHPARLMFGGDWPLCTVAGGYERWCEAVGSILGDLSPAERDEISDGTATRFYGVHP
jgi:L-fuconolactonase